MMTMPSGSLLRITRSGDQSTRSPRMPPALTWPGRLLQPWLPAPSGSEWWGRRNMLTCAWSMPRLCSNLLMNTEVSTERDR